jgi:L-glyceraldehyde 3-phosphate reductase
MFVRTPEQGLFETLTQLGVGSIVFSPLAQGLLTDRYLNGKIPKGSRASKSKHLTEQKVSNEYLRAAKKLDEIAASRGQSLSQLAISWVLRQPAVTSALIGASSVKQLEQNHAAISGKALTPAELAEIDSYAINGMV